MLVVQQKPKWKAPLGFNIIATGGDARMLDRMFQSIDGVADQIVVVMDEKARAPMYAVAKRYTDDVFMYPWARDFALARNRALAHTRTDYVSWIDADEWYEPAVAARIHSLMSRPLGKSYYIWQVSPTMSGDTLFVPQIRIFPNKDGVRWEIPIHEQVLPSLQRAGVTTQLTDLRVLHAGYLKPEMVWRKHNRNLQILRREVRRNPGDRFTRQNYHKALAFDRYWRRRRHELR